MHLSPTTGKKKTEEVNHAKSRALNLTDPKLTQFHLWGVTLPKADPSINNTFKPFNDILVKHAMMNMKITFF
jgi:hypothetical protein